MTDPQPDGHLPSALQRLQDAVSDIADPRTALAGDTNCRDCHGPDCPPTCTAHTCPGHYTLIPSLYMQLWDATAGAQGTDNRFVARSMPPAWLDVVDLRAEIDERLAIEQPAFRGVPPTVGRLRCITQRAFRPQDVDWIDSFVAVLQGWAADIVKLLDPPPRRTLPAPCPNCTTAIVYRRDSAGELVRQPALQIGVDGCRCMRCRAEWPPDRFVFLARILGYEPPVGMLESDTPQ